MDFQTQAAPAPASSLSKEKAGELYEQLWAGEMPEDAKELVRPLPLSSPPSPFSPVLLLLLSLLLLLLSSFFSPQLSFLTLTSS